MLRTGSALAGASVLAGLMPANLLSQPIARPGNLQQVTSSADRIAQMKAQMSAIPLVTTKLRDNIYLLSGPGGNMVVLSGADGKVLVDSGFSTAAQKPKKAMADLRGA